MSRRSRLPDSVEVYADEEVVCGIDSDVVVYTATGESGTALGVRLLDLFTLRDAKPAALTRPGPARIAGADAPRAAGTGHGTRGRQA